ncbi:MAG: hypothetical protein CG444_170, partial [Methanosaeta sp. ASP1-2]
MDGKITITLTFTEENKYLLEF